MVKKILIFILMIFFIVFIVACNQGENNNSSPVEEEKEIEENLENKVIVGVMIDYIPYIESGDNGLSGPYIEIISEMLDNLGYNYEFVALPWTRLINAVESGTVDFAIPFFDKEERRGLFYYEEEPIGVSLMSVIGLADTQVKFNGHMSSLRGYQVGVVQDYFYSEAFDNAVENEILKIESAISPEGNIDKLLQGRVDVIIEEAEAVKEYIRIHNITEELIYFDDLISINYDYIVFTKEKELSQLRRDIHEELLRMKENNQLYDIYDNYNMDDYRELFKDLEGNQPPVEIFFQDKSNTPLTIGVLGDTEPYAYYDGDDLTGFNIEFMSEILDRIGVEYEFIDLPFNRMLEELKNGSLDIGMDLYLKEDRQAYTLYPSLPYTAYPTVLFTKVGNEIDFSGNIEVLKPYLIGYIRGYYLGPLEDYKEDAAFDFVMTDSPEQNMENLLNDRVDLIIDIQSTGETILEKLNRRDEVVTLEPAIHYDYSYIGFSKMNGLEKLLAEYERIVRLMFEDGTIKALSEKYELPYLKIEDLIQ